MITDLDTRPDEVTALGNQILQAEASSEPEPNSFARSRGYCEALVSQLEGEGAPVSTHAELEEELQQDACELFRRLYQGHLDERAARECRHDAVVGSDGARRNFAEPGHERTLTTVFGDVRVSRIAYRSRGSRNLCPADGLLNLPIERRSHGLRRLGAIEATRGSFEEAAARSIGYLGAMQLSAQAANGSQSASSRDWPEAPRLTSRSSTPPVKWRLRA